jgi:hypothetical protein
VTSLTSRKGGTGRLENGSARSFTRARSSREKLGGPGDLEESCDSVTPRPLHLQNSPPMKAGRREAV